MDAFTVTATVSRPREEVFEYLADIANHAEFTDHFLKDFRLTREQSYGRGAGARYRVDMPLNRFPWADTTIVEFDPPYRLVEEGRGARGWLRRQNRRALRRLRAILEDDEMRGRRATLAR